MSSTSARTVDRVTVVGAGTMGHGIAQTFATAGFDVVLKDVEKDILDEALENIEESLENLGHDVEEALNRIELTTENEQAYPDRDLVVEAVPENFDLKKQVFDAIHTLADEETILATNTSTLPITEIAATTDRPEWVVGMHFSNPVQLMPIVEVIQGEHTPDELVETMIAISGEIGKTPVVVEQDVPGFVLNRINLRFWLEALRQVDAGIQEPKSIDAAFQRIGFPMGPFEVLDYSGIDVVLMAAQSMQERGVELHIPPVLKEKVEAGTLGMKSGEGFYEYPEPGEYSRVDISRDRRYEFDPKNLLAPAVNEAAWLLENEITTASEIDKAMQTGMNWPRGLTELADEYGIDRLVSHLTELERRSGWAEHSPQELLTEMVEDNQVGLASGEGFNEWKYEKTEFGPVQYERREYLAWITLNRPEALNALDEPSWNGLEAAFEHAAADDTVRATILQGAGRAFCAGDDIAELQEWDTRADASEMIRESIQPAVDSVRTHPKPVIAAIDGLANGGGCELVLVSDLAVSADSSNFALPEARLGALPPLGLTYGRMSVGRKGIMELALTNDQISASEAESLGIVNHTVAASQVTDVARELANETTSAAPGSVSAMKELWTDMENDLLDEWVDRALELLVERSQSAELEHGVSAFLEKDDPDWER